MSQIILKNIGRNKVNRTIEVEGKHNEETLANRAYKEVCKHLLSRGVELCPDEEKGAGHWKVYVGIGYHSGDVELITA